MTIITKKWLEDKKASKAFITFFKSNYKKIGSDKLIMYLTTSASYIHLQYANWLIIMLMNKQQLRRYAIGYINTLVPVLRFNKKEKETTTDIENLLDVINHSYKNEKLELRMICDRCFMVLIAYKMTLHLLSVLALGASLLDDKNNYLEVKKKIKKIIISKIL